MDIRQFCIFLFLQNYKNQSEFGKKELSNSWNNNQFNESIRSNNRLLSQSFSPINSPRTKMARNSIPVEQSSQILNFLKNNMKVILKILSGNMDSRVATDDFILLNSDINLLNTIFHVGEVIGVKDQKGKDPKKFDFNEKDINLFNINKNANVSSLLRAGKEFDSTEVLEVLNNIVVTTNENICLMNGLNKCVTIKDQSYCENKILKLSACEESFIYIDACVDYLDISNCTNCTIFVASVKNVCSVDKCEYLHLTVASNVLKIGNTIDSKFYTLSTYEPILFGDNKSIFLAPNNANYTELLTRIKQAEIPINSKSLSNFAYPFIFHEFWNITNITYTIENPKDFYPLILPDTFKPIPYNLANTLSNDYSFMSLSTISLDIIVQKSAQEFQSNPNSVSNGIYTGQIIPFLAPIEYRKKITERTTKAKRLKSSINMAGLTADQKEMVMNAVQGHFREWMSSTNESKTITELVKWIDND